MTEPDSPVVQGTIFDIQRFSLFDGPGIRTTVFLKGCPLNCLWCHNPEGISRKAQLLFNDTLCIHCSACVGACPNQAHQIGSDGRHAFDRSRCTICGACAEACPARALDMCGKVMTADEVMDEVLKDKLFYEESGGGMTLSGGEPLLQPAFSRRLLEIGKREGLATAVETSGCAEWGRYEEILPLTDLFLFDIKETDPARHKALTGVPLEPILGNLRQLSAAGATITLRLPFIPGCNARPEHIQAVARLALSLPGLEGVDLLPYHRLGDGKRTRLGLPETGPDSFVPEKETVDSWKAAFAAAGLRVRTSDES